MTKKIVVRVCNNVETRESYRKRGVMIDTFDVPSRFSPSLINKAELIVDYKTSDGVSIEKDFYNITHNKENQCSNIEIKPEIFEEHRIGEEVSVYFEVKPTQQKWLKKINRVVYSYKISS